MYQDKVWDFDLKILKLYQQKFALLVLAYLLSFCSSSLSEKEREAIRLEKDQREIRKIKTADIISAAYGSGITITTIADSLLTTALKFMIKDYGIAPAIEQYDQIVQPILDSISEANNAEIKRISHKATNMELRKIEKELLEAYQYNNKSNLELTDNVQVIDDNLILYSKPLIINDPLCLNCHGIIGKDLTDFGEKMFQSLNTNDTITGYKRGDLIGMWSVLLSKKEIINSL